MFRISIKETQGQRRLVVHGELVSPWTTELETAWSGAGENLQGRKLIIDLSDVTIISPEGEKAIFKLMRGGAHFVSCGVLTKHMLGRLARRCREAMTGVHDCTKLGSSTVNEIGKES